MWASLLDLWILIQVVGKFLARKLSGRICFIIVLLRSLRSNGLCESRSRDRLLQKAWFTKFAPSGTQISLDDFSSRLGVYEFSPCITLLFPLREQPKSPRNHELAECRIFLLSNPPVRSAGWWSMLALRSLFFFEQCLPQVPRLIFSFKRIRERMGSAGRTCLFDGAHKMTLMDQELQNLFLFSFDSSSGHWHFFFEGRDKHNLN